MAWSSSVGKTRYKAEELIDRQGYSIRSGHSSRILYGGDTKYEPKQKLCTEVCRLLQNKKEPELTRIGLMGRRLSYKEETEVQFFYPRPLLASVALGRKHRVVQLD